MKTQKKSEIPQDRLGIILFMFAWPTAWFMFLIYGIGRQLIPAGETTPTWLVLAIMVVGNSAELIAGWLLLRREGYDFASLAFRERIRWCWPKNWKLGGLAIIGFIIAVSIGEAMAPLNRQLAATPGFAPPEWWGPMGNPNADSAMFADVQLRGNFLFLIVYVLIGVVFNILGEELYYRGYLLPRMKGIFGKFDWVANGILFTLKHLSQRWMLPGILVGGLSFAFAAGPFGSLPLAMIYHWAGNYLAQLMVLIPAVMGK